MIPSFHRVASGLGPRSERLAEHGMALCLESIWGEETGEDISLTSRLGEGE